MSSVTASGNYYARRQSTKTFKLVPFQVDWNDAALDDYDGDDVDGHKP